MSNAETIAVAASVFDTSVNIADTVKTYAKLNANTAAYMENLDIIAYLAENGDRKMVRDAANQIYGVFASGFKDYNVQLGFAVLHDILMGGTEYAVSKFVELNPYTKAAKAAYDVLDLLLGMSHKAECIDNSLCWESMIQAVKELALSTLVETRFSYDCKAADHLVSDRYLTHLAQLRIVGEQNFVDYAKIRVGLRGSLTTDMRKQSSFVVQLLEECGTAQAVSNWFYLRHFRQHFFLVVVDPVEVEKNAIKIQRQD